MTLVGVAGGVPEQPASTAINATAAEHASGRVDRPPPPCRSLTRRSLVRPSHSGKTALVRGAHLRSVLACAHERQGSGSHSAPAARSRRARRRLPAARAFGRLPLAVRRGGALDRA